MTPITNCRSCGSPALKDFLNLGEQYISDFREDNKRPPKYPLIATYCENCTLVQLRHSTPQPEMYHSNYGFKSGVSDSIKKDLDEIVTHAFQWVNDPFSWLDIASNDGTLLSFVPKDVYRVGVDPVKFLCEEARQHADYIVNDYFGGNLDVDVETFEVITSISCFYDMPNPNQFVKDVKRVMRDKSVWIIQQNYLLTTLELGAVDNFCHEHLEYYTLLSLEWLLERHGLEVIEVTTSMVNGGSIRTVVAHKGVYPVQDSVERQRTIELDAGLDYFKTYTKFAEEAQRKLRELHRLVEKLATDGNSIFILAASTRGSTIWQAAEIEPYVGMAVERNPAKVGKYFSALGIPIISEEAAREFAPDFMLVGPWFFADEIIEREEQYMKDGGRLIIPLPDVMVEGRL